MAHLLFSGLSKTTKDRTIRKTFAGVTDVDLGYDQSGKYLRFALVSFDSQESLHTALGRCGELVSGRPLIVSTPDEGPFYCLVRDLSPAVKNSHLVKHFRSSNGGARDPVVYLPLANKVNKGFSFVYVASADHLQECLGLDGSYLEGKKISVIPGLFPCGRGRKRV